MAKPAGTAQAIWQRLRWPSLLVVLLVTGGALLPVAARAMPAKQILAELDRVIERAKSNPAGEQLQSALKEIITQAYGLSNASRLNHQVYVALFSETRLSPGLCYAGFCESTERHSSASIIKVVTLVAVVREIEAGCLTWETMVEGRTVEEQVGRMIKHSSNDAYNALTRLIGFESINAWLTELGFAKEELYVGHYLLPASNAGGKTCGRNRSTAAGLAKLFFLIAQEEEVEGFLSAAGLSQVRELLSSPGPVNNDPGHNDRLNGCLPGDVCFMHKTGFNKSVLADGGIVQSGDAAFIVVVFDKAGSRGTMRQLGLKLFDYATAQKAPPPVETHEFYQPFVPRTGPVV